MNTKRLVQIMLIFLFLYTFHITLYTNISFAASKGNPPVAHWKFDEGGGPTAYDESSNNNDGTLTGAVWVFSGKSGRAVSFAGANEYVNIPNSATLENVQESNYSLSAYFKPTNVPPGSGSANDAHYAVIMKTGNHTGLRYTNGQKFVMEHWLTGYVWSGVTSTNAFPPGQYYHVEGTVDKTNGVVKIYVNGVYEGQGTFTPNTAALEYGTTTWKVGIANPGAGSYRWAANGQIDDVKIYNYVRTAEQVLVDCNAGAAAHLGAGTDANEGTPPVGYWPLDENTGTTAYDRSGSGYNGTITGASWALGKVGQALSFDGNDYISVGNLGNMYTQGTISFWMKPSVIENYRNPFTTKYNGGNVGIRFEENASGRFVAVVGNDAGTYVAPEYLASGLQADIWYHVVLAWDQSTNNLKGYLNGMNKFDQSHTYWATTMPAVTIGHGYSTAAERQWNGLIDDVKIYNYARTPGQIAWDYNRGKPVAHYRFDEGAGTIAHNEYSTADTGAAPVGWWRMDNSWTDSSGNGFNGTATGATFSASSKIGPYCGNFDGLTNYVSGSIAQSLSANNITVEAWVNFTDFNAGHENPRVIEIQDSSYSVQIIRDNSTGKWATKHSKWETANAGTTWSTPSAAAWYHVAAVFDTTNSTTTFYVNGAAQTGASFNNIGVGNQANKFYIGVRSDLTGTSYLKGLIDDVRIYNYARTAEQIYNDYKTTHGTLVGNAKFADGKINKALTFDGAGDYVMVGDADNLDISNAFTISMWMKPDLLSQTNRYLLSKLNNAGNDNAYSLVWEYVNDTVEFYAAGYSGDNPRTGTGILIGDTNWHHIVYAYNGSTWSGYKDGAQQFSLSKSFILGVSTGNLLIGHFDGVGSFSFDGSIDDVRIYNYARSADQILQDFNAGATTRLGTQSAGEADPWGGALPVAHWKMDENTGVVAQDASGNGNDGTVSGTTVALGKHGGARHIAAGTNRIIIPDPGSSVLDISLSYTLEAWADFDDIGVRHHTLIDKGSVTSNGWRLIADGSRNILLQIKASDAWYTAANTGAGAHTTGQWYHIAYVWNGTTGTVYIDGQSKGTSTISQQNLPTNNESVILGNWGTGYDSNAHSGRLDDVKIYNYARTQAQIAWDYNRGKPVAHYRFNEGSGTTAYDESDNNNDGTITIGATGTQTTIASAWTNGATGKFGKSMSFDGTDDYVSCGNGASVNFGAGNFAIEAWIKTSADVPAGEYDGIAAKYASGIGPWIQLDGNQYIIFGWTGVIPIQGDIAVNDGKWHHIVAQRTGSTSAELYLDGVLHKSTAAAPSGTSDSAVNLDIGRIDIAGRYFNGLIDDVRAYNYARTAEQIQQDYLNGASARLGD